ncbi:MAG: ABC transporter ATP-binding protein [Proteobacteria bacterium]|jgi:phospholipid/cholesterol/gamma-HCH transport system ATP-binding protein|nr:ABC transporter ATP-binding protein [Pseudomonadota bacterium]
MIENAISLKDVWKTFDGKEYILKGMNLDIKKGSLTAIIGFSGTGKSVMLKHILGLFPPSRGSIEVLGHNITQFDKNQLTAFRRNFGVLFQGAALFDDMTVLENVCFPLFEHRRDLKKETVFEIATRKLKQVGLEEKHFQKLPSQISGGMQKRTGLARALALDPEILFYDEPTTGLDPILTEMVDNLILETHKAGQGTTSVMVSHDLHAAFRIADYVAMLNAGQVLLYGTPEDFFKTDIELVKKFVDKGMRHQ